VKPRPLRLTDRVTGGRGTLGGFTYEIRLGASTGSHPYGIEIDGAIYPLQGEPPLAATKGWGRVPGW
jgi:hypothetical protein